MEEFMTGGHFNALTALLLLGAVLADGGPRRPLIHVLAALAIVNALVAAGLLTNP